MKIKLIVFAILVGLLWKFKSPAVGDVKNNLASESIPLLPLAIGNFERQASPWKFHHADGVIEVGAMYSKTMKGTNSNVPVQLDFYRFAHNLHNGLVCYLNTGERLRWSEKQRLSPKVQVLMSLTQSDRQLRLVATTECYADHCDEVKLNSKWTLQIPDWAPLMNQSVREQSVVPMSVVLTADIDNANQAQVEQKLKLQMENFLMDFDFAPVTRVAALQIIS